MASYILGKSLSRGHGVLKRELTQAAPGAAELPLLQLLLMALRSVLALLSRQLSKAPHLQVSSIMSIFSLDQ
jgi:hypothetical protein